MSMCAYVCIHAYTLRGREYRDDEAIVNLSRENRVLFVLMLFPVILRFANLKKLKGRKSLGQPLEHRDV